MFTALLLVLLLSSLGAGGARVKGGAGAGGGVVVSGLGVFGRLGVERVFVLRVFARLHR